MPASPTAHRRPPRLVGRTPAQWVTYFLAAFGVVYLAARYTPLTDDHLVTFILAGIVASPLTRYAARQGGPDDE